MDYRDLSVEQLTQAFNTFTGVFEKIQATNTELQKKVEQLSSELDKKNQQLQQRLNENKRFQDFLNSILENIHSGVIVLDMAGSITVLNRAAQLITGLEPETVIGTPYREAFAANGIVSSKGPLYTLGTGHEFRHQQKTITTLSGQEVKLEFSTTLIRDNTGQVTGVAEVFNDISELKNLQKKITQIETLAALGEMAAGVAHEIRNPLSGISGFVGLLERRLDADDPRKQLIDPIKQGVVRLNGIVSNLLDFTRERPLSLRQVPLNELLLEITDFFKISIAEKPKQVQVSLDSSMQQDVMVDTKLMHQVLINLLQNAWDAVPEDGGHIELGAVVHTVDDMAAIIDEDEKNELIKLFSFIEISVSDNGSGIAPNHQEKLFHPFFTTKEQGNGLGLAICRKIVQQHGGDVSVESELGSGTRFSITLPLYPETE